MLRPATPLCVILLAAFVLTLLSVLSAPVIKSIPLGQYNNTNLGVFGYCVGDTCNYKIGYQAPQAQTGDDKDFDISSGASRQALTWILIVHPVACLFQLICTVLAIVAHFHSPSHSSRYLLGSIIFMLPTLLLTLLSFLVDILLFIPHVGWAGWLVLGAVVLDVVGGIMLCAMRRTLVSRKARKKRIAENAEMSGENFYNRQAAERSMAPSARADSPPPLSNNEPTVPMVNGAPGADKLPSFTTYDQSRVSDDRVPLNERTETATTTSSGFGRPSQDGSEYYGAGAGRGGPNNRGRGGRQYSAPRDEFGNPIPQSQAFGPRGQDGRGGFRGRGGPGMGPRGGYAGRGAPGYGPGPGRGGPPGGPGRGGMGPAFGAGAAAGALAGSRGPPPGYTNDDYPMQDRPPMNGYGPRRQSPGPPSAPGYGPRRQSPGPPSAPGYGRSPSAGRQRSPGPPSAPGYGQAPQEADPYARAESPPPLPGAETQFATGVARAESPPPLGPPADHVAEMEAPQDVVIGQAVEMDERTGSPAQTPHVAQSGFQAVDSPLRQTFHPAPQSPSSHYSSQPSHRPQDSVARGDSVAYVPARAAWQTQRHQTPPVELAGSTQEDSHQRKASESYYEDVDPRFSQDQSVPALLVPGPGSNTPQPVSQMTHRHLAPQPIMQHNNSYNSYDSAGRASEASHFTSISERGVNPAWEGYDQQGAAPNRGPARQDVLQNNPDFQLPGGRGRGGAPGRGGYNAGY